MTKQFTTTESDVLFQRLGDTWYIFTEIDGEVIFSALPKGVSPHSQEIELYTVIKDHMKKVAKFEKRRRNREIAA